MFLKNMAKKKHNCSRRGRRRGENKKKGQEKSLFVLFFNFILNFIVITIIDTNKSSLVCLLNFLLVFFSFCKILKYKS